MPSEGRSAPLESPGRVQRLLVLFQRGGEGGGAGEQPLLQRLQHELGGELLGVVLAPGLAQFGVLAEGGVDGLLLLRVGDFQRLQHPLREPGRAVPLRRQLGLEPAHHDRIKLLAVGLGATGETLVVEQFEQGGEDFRVAVVRRGRQEQLVLKVRGQHPEGLGAQRVGGVLAPARWGAVVRLVHDQQIIPAGVDRLVWPRQDFPEQPQRTLPLEEVDGGDEPGEMRPGIDVDAPAAPQFLHQRAVHDAEVEAELVPHLLLPLDLQRRGADDQDAPGTVADDEFQGRHAGLDGLAQAHVVGDEQVDPRHLDGPHHRVKLIVLDVDAERKGAWMFFTSAVEAAPQRTASRKASSLSGGSKPVGSGRATFSMTLAPGSISQMTCTRSDSAPAAGPTRSDPGSSTPRSCPPAISSPTTPIAFRWSRWTAPSTAVRPAKWWRAGATGRQRGSGSA